MALFLPPVRFHPVGEIEWAEFRLTGPWKTEPRRTGARAAGLRFERKTHSYLGRLFGPEQMGALYCPAQWIEFTERGGVTRRWAQPDGLLFDLSRGLVIIVEVKLRHMQKAWWSCRRLYEPLIRHLFPSWQVACLEVVRWYDPAVPWPEPLRLVRSPSDLKAGEFGCHFWNGAAAGGEG